jgi:GxxExxY protein
MGKIRQSANADAEFAEFEPALVDVALTGRPEDVANVGRRWRDALDDHLDRDGSEPKQTKQDTDHQRRRANFSRTFDGIGILDGTFDTEGAEIIDTALRRCYERNHQANDPRTPAQQRADAIVDIFQHYLDHQDRGANRPHRDCGDESSLPARAWLDGKRLHACLLHEIRKQGLTVESQVGLPVVYDGEKIDLGYRIDLVVEDLVIVEIKCVEAINPVHQAQLLSYMRLSGRSVGLLINFHHLRDGIKRMVDGRDWNR